MTYLRAPRLFLRPRPFSGQGFKQGQAQSRVQKARRRSLTLENKSAKKIYFGPQWMNFKKIYNLQYIIMNYDPSMIVCALCWWTDVVLPAQYISPVVRVRRVEVAG